MVACAALVSHVPTFVAAICTLNNRPSRMSGLHAEAGEPARAPRPAADHAAADHEAHPREPERRRVFEAELDHDAVGAPEDRDEHGHGRALEDHVFRGMAQNALENTTPGIIAP